MKKQELDINAIWIELWAKKWIIIVVTGIFAVSSVFYALSIANTYKSEAILASAKSDSSSSLASLAGQFSGLANLAGLNLGSGSNIFVLMEQVKSKDFVNYFVAKHDLLVPLFAATNWDPTTNQLQYDNQKDYDVEQNKWIRDVKLPLKAKPSSDEIHEEFMKRFSVERDRKTKIVTVKWTFLSPETAQQWLQWYLADFNDYVRNIDMVNVDKNLNYLYQQVEKTEIAQVQAVLYSLIEEQIKKQMLSQVQIEYALRTIDSPSLPSEKTGPRRAMIAIGGTFVGGFLSCLIILLLFFIRWESAQKTARVSIA